MLISFWYIFGTLFNRQRDNDEKTSHSKTIADIDIDSEESARGKKMNERVQIEKLHCDLFSILKC